MRDAIVPAEGVLVEKHPCVAHAERETGQAGGQHAPAAQGSIGRSSVEAGQIEASSAQSRSTGGVDNQQVLIGRPEQAGDSDRER